MVGSMLDQMGDESVCELLEVGLGMLARARLSEGLRSTAQSCVQTIIRAAFTRLKTLTPEDVEALLEAAKKAEAERDSRQQQQQEQGKAAVLEAPHANDAPDGDKNGAGPEQVQDLEKARQSTDTTASKETVPEGEPESYYIPGGQDAKD